MQQCVTLLLRCKKMYEAKACIQTILKMAMDKDRMLAQVRDGGNKDAALKNRLRKVIERQATLINALQEEHRILRRPFVLLGQDYLSRLKQESSELEAAFNKTTFIDETGTIGHNYTAAAENQ